MENAKGINRICHVRFGVTAAATVAVGCPDSEPEIEASCLCDTNASRGGFSGAGALTKSMSSGVAVKRVWVSEIADPA